MLGEESSRVVPQEYFEVKSVFGYNLKHGVVAVGVVVISISLLTFLASVFMVYKITSTKERMINNNPEKAADLMLGLLTASVSCYQIIVSILMLQEVLKKPETTYHFKCNMWFISHVNLFLLYGTALIAKAIVSFKHKYIITGLMTMTLAIIYESFLFYACMIVNNYVIMMDIDVRPAQNCNYCEECR